MSIGNEGAAGPVTAAAPAAAPVEVLGCRFDRVTMDQAVAYCLDACAAHAGPRTVLTANAAILVAMQDDPALREACLASRLTVADGMSVVWAARLLGTPLPERVAGIDLMLRLLEEGGRRRLRVFLLGARREVLERTIEICRERYPGLVIAGARDGYFGRDEDAEVARQVCESRADILFIGMPSPLKDVWAHRHLAQIGATVIIGVGGSFDVLAGAVRRAPAWMQRVGLEWGWRLLMEPRRMWRRYLRSNPAFVRLVLRQLLDQRGRARRDG